MGVKQLKYNLLFNRYGIAKGLLSYLVFAVRAVVSSVATSVAVFLVLKALLGFFAPWIAILPVLVTCVVFCIKPIQKRKRRIVKLREAYSVSRLDSQLFPTVKTKNAIDFAQLLSKSDEIDVFRGPFVRSPQVGNAAFPSKSAKFEELGSLFEERLANDVGEQDMTLSDAGEQDTVFFDLVDLDSGEVCFDLPPIRTADLKIKSHDEGAKSEKVNSETSKALLLLEEFLKEIPELDKEIIMLRSLKRLPWQEVHQALATQYDELLTETVVRERGRRALARFRKALEETAEY
ncbi:MAG: hypothetical protein AAFP09_01025 [Cyanobacteria bacterium J06607_10]